MQVEATPLARELAKRIRASGPISLHDYMAACLYDPRYGYYRTAAPVGARGDFVTAPEISQVFGEMIGVWVAAVWERMGRRQPWLLVELGPGRGTLMADALRLLRAVPGILDDCRIVLVETSDALAAEQRAALVDAPAPVLWAQRVEEVPEGPAIIIANEFLDCLPVRQFVFDESSAQWRERCVGLDAEGSFTLVPGASSGPPGPLPGEPADRAILEVRPGVDTLLDTLSRRSGAFAALILDYGHERSAFGDTVQAVRHHHFAGLFDGPGEMDLTAHVDFGHLGRAAREKGLAAHGPMPMGEFLLKLGLEQRVARILAAAAPEQAASFMEGVKRLIDPRQMGVLFKALAIAAAGIAPMPPFDVSADHSSRGATAAGK